MEKQKAPRQKSPGERARRGYHHGDLRKAVLEESLGHINRTRDTSFTLRELAARLGVSSTALYRHFDNKLALLAAVAEEGFKELLRRFLADDHLKGSDALAFMAARGLAYVQFAIGYPAHFRVMFLPELRQPGQFVALTDLRQQVYAQLEVALALLKERDFLSDADLREIALTSWATVHGLSTLLVDGHVRLESGSAEEVLALVRRVLSVQAEGFLKDGLRLSKQEKSVARGPAKKPRRSTR
jgi:AcrR family transcriptional regulator